MLRIRCALLYILFASLAAQGQKATISIASIESLIRSQKYDEALQSTETALRVAPNDFKVWTLQAIAHSLKGDRQDALRDFDKALSISPNYIAALKGEAQLLYPMRDKRAISVLNKIVQLSPKDSTAHEMLGVLEQKHGLCKEAIGNFLLSGEVIETHPASLEAYGFCLAQTEHLQQAIDVYGRLAALIPQSTYPRYDMAVLLVQTKQYEAAIKALEPLIGADQNDSETLSLASEAYEAIGNTPKSVSLLRQAIVLSPTEASYYNTFAAICLDHDSFQVGIDMINAGLQRIPDDSSLYISRGLLYAQLANYEQAEADFNTAERLDPKQSISTYAMDMIDLQKNLNLSDKDHPEASLAEIRSQLKVHPDSPYLNFLLATLLVNQGGETQEDGVESKPFDEAMNAALRAVKLTPEMVKARDILATMYINSGHYDLAAEQCKIALQYAPTDKTALYHLIVALRHSGQNEKHEEIQVLVKRLSELQQTSLRQETERKRFKLEEGPAFSK